MCMCVWESRERRGSGCGRREGGDGEAVFCVRGREYANKSLMHMQWHTLPSGTGAELNPDLYVAVEATVG